MPLMTYLITTRDWPAAEVRNRGSLAASTNLRQKPDQSTTCTKNGGRGIIPYFALGYLFTGG